MSRPLPLAPEKPQRRRLMRRSLLGLGGWMAQACGSAVQAAGYAGTQASAAVPGAPVVAETRLALLLGNRSYPSPFDLPPIPKNVRDLNAVLTRRGFKVTDALDLDLAASQVAMRRFIAEASQSPPDATIFFYYCGHGVQFDSANLLIPAGLNPSAQGDVLNKGSLRLLDDVVRRIPERQQGMIIAVVDACRTGLKAGEITGLNQVEAPPGCLIAFSTGAGKPAVAPAVETQNTFYTGSLVRLMDSVSDETTFPELLSLVRTDVRNTMLNHPVQAIRTLAQDPFIADHTHVWQPVAPRSVVASVEKKPAQDDTEEQDWARLQKLTWPAEVVQGAEAFLKARPGSRYAGGATVARDGAQAAVKALQRNDVRLYRTAFNVADDMNTEHQRDLIRAARGDKDAAARMASRYREVSSSATQSRFEGWLQYAVALGNGIASYELAVHYRAKGQPLLASQFEARARELGYTPPPDLDNVRK